MNRYISAVVIAACLVLAASPSSSSSSSAAEDAGQGKPATPARKVFLDKGPKIAAFQLGRLKNPELLAVERKTDHPKYKPVYEAMLVRKDLERKYRQEAAAALAALNKTDPVVEILGGIGKVEKEDAATQSDLVGLLLTQKPEALTAQKPQIEALAKESESTSLKEAAYAALVVADGKPDAVWQGASKDPATLQLVLGAVSMLPDEKLKVAVRPLVRPLVDNAPDEATRLAAVDALGFIPAQEAESFATLSPILRNETGDLRAAAVRSLRRIPAAKWPKDSIEPLAKDIVKLVSAIPGDQRAAPAVIEMIQLGEELAGSLPREQGTPIRKSLRELGVRTILVRTLREQMAYDLRYFVVQAGKPVQIILDNPDAMPHNLVVTLPGSVEKVGVAGSAMQPSNDPKVKPFVPDMKEVLHASELVAPGKSDTLAFEAPKEPGEYDYVCTFPGHWPRMYGVMLVVPDLDAYDANPTVPTDPLTKKPFESARQTSADLPPAEHEH